MESPGFLQTMRLFRELSRSELTQVAKVCVPRKCKRGSTIITEGDSDASIYLVKKGELKVTHMLRGKRRELGTFRARDHFGEIAFIDKKPRSASIYATEDSELIIISRTSFDKLLHDSPRLQTKLMKALLEDLCYKLRDRNDVLDFELSDLLPVSIFEIDANGNVTFTNRTGLESFGYSQRDFEKGLTALQMIVPLEREKASEDLRKLLSGKKLGVTEYTALRKNGSTFPIMVHSDPIFKGRKAVGVRGTFIDITERHVAEGILRESEERYRIVAETATDAIITINAKSEILFVNPATERIFGYGASEMLGQSITMLMPQYLQDRHHSSLQHYVKTGSRNIPWQGVELPGLRKDGKEIQLEISFGEFNKNGTHLFTGIIRDISERRRAEAEKERVENELRESEERYRLLFQMSPYPAWVFDRETLMFLAVNDAAVKRYGFSREEFLSMTLRDIRPVEDIKALLNKIPELSEEYDKGGAWRHRKKDGTIIDVEIHSQELLFDGRQAHLVIANDITEQKELERALRKTHDDLEERVKERTAELIESEERYRLLFEESKDVVFISTIEGRLLDVNQAGVELFGYRSKSELLAAEIAPVLYWKPEERKKFMKAFQQQGFVKDFEIILKRKDGAKLTLLETATAVRNEKGGVVGYRGILRDITDKKKSEEKNRELLEKLRKAEMMEAMGRLVSGVAHEVRNPLNAIQATTEAMQQDLRDNEEFHASLEIIRSQVGRLSALMSELLELGRPVQPSRMVAESLPNLCVMAIELWKQTSRNQTHNVSFLYPDCEIIASLDGARIQQVLLNLLDNASQHSPPGSEIWLTLSSNHENSRLTVEDQGTGIPHENLPRLFEPFFTTRRGGTGLGLSLVKHIIEAHGGSVRIYNNAASPGSTVEINLPVATVDDDLK